MLINVLSYQPLLPRTFRHEVKAQHCGAPGRAAARQRARRRRRSPRCAPPPCPPAPAPAASASLPAAPTRAIKAAAKAPSSPGQWPPGVQHCCNKTVGGCTQTVNTNQTLLHRPPQTLAKAGMPDTTVLCRKRLSLSARCGRKALGSYDCGQNMCNTCGWPSLTVLHRATEPEEPQLCCGPLYVKRACCSADQPHHIRSWQAAGAGGRARGLAWPFARGAPLASSTKSTPLSIACKCANPPYRRACGLLQQGSSGFSCQTVCSMCWGCTPLTYTAR